MHFLEIFDLEQWSFAATIWAGFGSLALVPIFQMARRRHDEKIKEHKSIRERLDDLCHRLGLVEDKTKKNEQDIEDLSEKFYNMDTDVKVLEALSDREQDDDRKKGHKRKQDDREQYG